MEIAGRLDTLCTHLESSKITLRKQGCDHLNEFLNQEKIIKFLTESELDWWNKILHSIQICLNKDYEKKLDESRKKGISVLNTAFPSADLLEFFVRTAIKQNSNLNYRSLFKFITQILNDLNKRAFHHTLLRILDWGQLFLTLKLPFEKSNFETEQLKCLNLVVKWGPLCTFPVYLLRDEFSFIIKLARSVTVASPKPQQEALLELILEFCKHTSSDNRMQCCKLGEEIFPNLIELYQRNKNDDKIKTFLFDFFHLQVTIHHPKGVRLHHKAAYAVSWPTWNKCLNDIYDILTEEIVKSLDLTFHKHSFFVNKTGNEIINSGFVSFFVDVCRQLYRDDEIKIANERPHKRPRFEYTINGLLEKIKSSKSWIWLHLTNEFVKIYPDMFTNDDFDQFFNVLTSLQVDCKNAILLKHIHNGLLLLLKLEMSTNDRWDNITDSALRLISQIDEEIQMLLQELILRKYITSHETLFQYYRPGALQISQSNLKTLKVAFENFSFLQYDTRVKKDILHWILSQNSTHWRSNSVAEIAVFLILKQWPSDERNVELEAKRVFSDLEDVYMTTSLEDLLSDSENLNKTKSQYILYADPNMLKFLTDLLINLADNVELNQPIWELANLTVLVFTIVSFLLKFEIIDIESDLLGLFEVCTNKLLSNLELKVEKSDERQIKKIMDSLKILDSMFSTKISDFVSKKLREFVPENLIRDLFHCWRMEFDDMSQENICKVFKQGAMKTLVSFSVLPDCANLSPNQESALEVLLEAEYSCDNDGDFELVLALLNFIKNARPKSLSENNLLSIYNIFQRACEIRYRCSLSAVAILDQFHDIYLIVAESDSDLCKNEFVKILFPFYSNRSDYGPGVSLRLIKSIKLLFELGPSCTFTKWSNEEIIFKLPEFLTSEYQEVRFCAINALSSFFKISSRTRLLEQFHRQEIMFSKISQMSLKILQVEGNVSEERAIDETVSRSACILHIFASVMMSSHLWVEEAFFTLLKIVCDKNLDQSQLVTILEKVSNNLEYSSYSKFLEKYVVGIVSRWKGCDFDKFPFTVFNCDSKIQFYKKYWSLLAHIFIENEANSLNQVASNFDTSLQTLMEDTCTRLFSYCIGQEMSDLALITQNNIYRLLSETIGINKTREIVGNNIEEVVLCLIEFVSDEQNFRDYFGKNVIFPKTNDVRVTVEAFYEGLQFIENTLYNEKSVIEILLRENPKKIHFILLQLNMRINTSLVLEERLRFFHLYSIVSDLCLDAVMAIPSFQTYLIRDLTHSLLRYIKNYKKEVELSEISCKFFKKMLKKILPNLAEVVNKFFVTIISRLKNIGFEDSQISPLCVDILQILIVEHRDDFRKEIEKIDSIPDTNRFEKIRCVHHDTKCGERKVTLDDEIKLILELRRNIESLDECEASLKNLKILLTKRKDELKKLCLDLRNTRGWSKDCENSNLHKLICLLIKLSLSNNKNVSSEAARCLGEIGPLDLNTLILQPEKIIPDVSWTPWELFLGYVVSLLSTYIVDSDVGVVTVASAALFNVLSTNEGRKVAESGTDFGFGAINRDFLVPFCAASLRKTPFNPTINLDHFLATLRNPDLWIPPKCSHTKWIVELICAILETFKESAFSSALREVCKIKVEFCEQILPPLIYTILNYNIPTLNTVISTQMATFFTNHWYTTIHAHPPITITTNKFSVQSMLNTIHFLRLQQSARKRPLKNLHLDYLKIAKAAHFCSAHFTALFYADMWCQEQIEQLENNGALSTCSYTKLDLVYDKLDDVTGQALQNILRQAYKSVGEVDALSGCGTAHLLHPSTRVEHYKELGRWDNVCHLLDLEVERGLAKNSLVDSLKDANMYQMSLFCSERPDYECLWRLSKWQYTETDSSQNYDKCKFYAFKALNDNDEFSFAKMMDLGKAHVVKDFENNMESIKNFYKIFSKLQSLNEMEDAARVLGGGEIVELLEKWRAQDEIISNDFQYVEPLHAQRIVLLTGFLKKPRPQVENFKETIMDTIIGYAKYARTEGHSRVAFRTLDHLRDLQTSSDIFAKIKIEEAQLCWKIEDVVSAKCILKQLCGDENIDPRLHAMALKMTGTWMVESAHENRQTIIENYLKKSIDLLKSQAQPCLEDEKMILDTFDQIAKFADREYQEVMSHIKSDIFNKKKENIVKAKQVVSTVNLKKATKDLKKAVAIKQKQSCIDEIEITNIETEKNNLLKLALRYYLLNLIGSDDHNMTIFRLFSLLLENKNNESIIPVLQKDLLKIPSYKFLSILPQMTPHIASPSDPFCQFVNAVIEKCAKEHPHHTLPLLLSLALSNKDRDYTESKNVVNDARTSNAKIMLKKLENEPNLRSLIEKMEYLSEAIIELAYSANDGYDDSQIRVPKNCKIRKIKNYDDILLPTCKLSVDKSSKYDKIVGIAHFGDFFQNVGGINAPKRITCKGTDGVSRTQLIKRQDDLRQDAVMQQVFTIMNDLLKINKQTKNLLIRTYKIVPLSMRSGILEWVENTMPIGEYLTGKGGDGGAHVQFRPTDKNPLKCRAEFKNSANRSNEERLKRFNKICEAIKPVFHKFFETEFPQPTVWYEKRRAYIHSVATSSMCGYILGIGDRHVNNILIDKSTAEVVHIDFGIAFEQGRVLPTPETVPFRLTRDIVDGMGVSGVEGVFRRSCEKTVEVLRENYQTIITILEVLLYDPLYDWTVSTAEANKRQKDGQDDSFFNESIGGGTDDNASKDVNVTAERALLRLRAKLLGTESGKSTSVEHQVGSLIQQAVDPTNLSRLFYGWQPYL